MIELFGHESLTCLGNIRQQWFNYLILLFALLTITQSIFYIENTMLLQYNTRIFITVKQYHQLTAEHGITIFHSAMLYENDHAL
jgi:hypothetical protein